MTPLFENRRGSVFPLLDILEKQRKKGKKRPETTLGSTRQAPVKKLCSSVRAAVIPPGKLSIFSPRPKSQMVFGAFGTLQSQRLKKLSAVFMEAERRSRQLHFTAVIRHFKAAFNVVSVLLQLLCPSGSDLSGRAVIRPIKWD